MKALISILMAIGCAFALHYIYLQFEGPHKASSDPQLFHAPVSSDSNSEAQMITIEQSDSLRSLEESSLAPRLRQMIQTQGSPLNPSYTSPDAEYAL